MAETSEIIDVLESLALHCRPPIMAVEDRAKWMRDWVEDLKSYPIAPIKAATTRWRHGENQKFPTPGQLLPIVRANASPDRDASPVAEPWRQISDEAYDALSLRDKRRHQMILAQEARTRAGPMWKHAKPAGPDELPEHWHEWTRKARNHESEAQRLFEIISKLEKA